MNTHKTLEQSAKALEISTMQVRTIESKALNKLKKLSTMPELVNFTRLEIMEEVFHQIREEARLFRAVYNQSYFNF